MSRHFEMKPCTLCGHVRRVLVYESFMSGGAPWWDLRCTACRHEARATIYEVAAQKHREAARAIRERRAARAKKGG